MNKIEVEAVKTLRDMVNFHKLLKAMKEKYLKTGKLTGKVEVKDLTLDESLTLSALNSDIYGKESAKVDIKKFIKFFTKGRYENIDFTKVFIGFFGGELKTKKEKAVIKEEEKDNFNRNLLKALKSEEVANWVQSLISNKKYGYNIFIKQYKENKTMLYEIVKNIERAKAHIDEVKDIGIALPLLSSKVTKDSHYFDINKVAGKLMLHFLAFNSDFEFKFDLEKINEVLSVNGIIRDEVSNSTLTSALYCFKDGIEIIGMEWFRENNESLILNLQNLKAIDSIKAKNNMVFVFENPIVFYEVLNSCKSFNPSLICISGQPNTSTHRILSKLKEGGADIYYSGDFDPEGIIICDNLRKRYGDNFKFIYMNEKYYKKTISDNSFENRIKKLDKIHCDELKTLVDIMKITGKSGYQEILTKDYIEFIKENLKVQYQR